MTDGCWWILHCPLSKMTLTYVFYTVSQSCPVALSFICSQGEFAWWCNQIDCLLFPVSYSSLPVFSEITFQINYLYWRPCVITNFWGHLNLNSLCSCTTYSQHTMAASFEYCHYHHAAEEPTFCPTALKETSVGHCQSSLCSPFPSPALGVRNETICPSAN